MEDFYDERGHAEKKRHADGNCFIDMIVIVYVFL